MVLSITPMVLCGKFSSAGYRLKTMIIEWPGGLLGDVGFFLQWGDAKH